MKAQLLIAAAGMGARLEAGQPKALTTLNGVPLLTHTVRRLAALDLEFPTVITYPREARDAFVQVLAETGKGRPCVLVEGGEERQKSVERGLDALDRGAELVIVHDAARPFVPLESVRAAMTAAQEIGAATVAVPVADTILEADEDGHLAATPDRSTLWACQTPQVFQVELLRDAHRAAKMHGWTFTDDATLVRRNGCRVKLVLGSPLNFKITTPADRMLAECVAREGLA